MTATETRHTPGPLVQHGLMVTDTPTTVGGMYAIQRGVPNGRGKLIGNGYCIGYAENRDDAILWAAAPDLLAACQRAVKWINERKGNLLDDPDESYAPKFLHAAIEKATAR
jgi:hypothetical protein